MIRTVASLTLFCLACSSASAQPTTTATASTTTTATSDPPAPPEGGQGRGEPPPIPEEAFSACADKKVGDTCTVTHGQRSQEGTCAEPPPNANDTRLACRPAHGPGDGGGRPGGGGRPPNGGPGPAR